MRHAPRPDARLAALAGVALLLIVLSSPAPAAAADGGLVVVAQSHYQVLPEEGRVRITIDALATSFEPDEPDAQVLYSGITFAVQSGASNVSASSGGRPLSARIVEENDDYAAIEVTFGRGIFFGQSYTYSVSFDLVDQGGDGNRDLRIGRSLVAFPVWAFGTEGEPGGSVQVDLPAGYAPNVQGSAMTRSQAAGGATILSAQLDDPRAFFAYVSADRPGAFVGTTLSLTIGKETALILVRAWEDDPDWGQRMAELMTDGLPALQALIGVDYPVSGRLSVEEAAISRLGEYAGIYNDTTGVIRVRYDADAYVALHEAAHVWFNGDLFRDRWINEAWAEFYAVAAAQRIGAPGVTYELTADLLDARIPLNDWGAVGVESLGVEDFAYAASYELAGLIAERAELAGLQTVWRAADAFHRSYQPLHAERPRTGVPFSQPDWQRLLDLLEEQTGVTYADLWAEWVVNQSQLLLLDERAEARARYAEVTDDAGAWELPESIRVEMGAWSFEPALAHLELAADILEQRDRIAARAATLDLEPPDTLQASFEGDDRLEEAAGEAVLELDVLATIAATELRLTDEPSPLELIGLVGSDPAAGLAAARDAFEAGKMDAADGAARDATEERDAAERVGRGRVVLGGAALLGLNGAALVAASIRRGRRAVAAQPATQVP